MNLILFVGLLVFCTAKSHGGTKALKSENNSEELDTQITLNNSQSLSGASVCFSYNRVYRKYHGCYRDNEARMFKRVFGFGDAITIDHCVHFCMLEGYVYAGVQFANCFCGNKFGKNPLYAKLGETACNNPCKGAQNEICGGEWANSVYETGNEIFVVKPDGTPANLENENFTFK